MKSNKDEILGLIIFWGFVILAVWLIDWNPFGNEHTIYRVDCLVASENGKCPARQEQPGSRISYRAQKETSSIVVQTDDQAPFKYSNCAIVDEKNWSCPSEYDAHHMVNGVLDDTTDASEYPRFVKKWQWWLIKIKRM